jgi:5'-nucleotidase
VRILLTNDDGIDAEGLQALERIAAQLSDDVWVCAPETEQSGASRALTLAMPVRVRRVGPKKFAVSGTPTDCVMLALHELVEGDKPDLVLSGVNRGQNLGEDVSMSGTVAAAMMGMAMGVPGVALSQALEVFHDDAHCAYDTAEAFAPGILAKLIETGWPKDVVLNINFPDLPSDQVAGVEVTRQGFRDPGHIRAERRTDLRGRDYFWLGFAGRRPRMDKGTDLAAVGEGKISVTPLHIDLTHMATVHDLKGVLGGAAPKLHEPQA